MDHHFSSFSLKKQRFCRTTNPLHQLSVMNVGFKTFRPFDGDYCYWTFIQAKLDVKEEDVLCIILCCFFSSTLACLFCCISLSHLAKAILLTASLVSCSWAYLRAAFKPPLRSPISLPLCYSSTGFCRFCFNKPMELLSGNHWFEEPNLKYFMERGQAQQHHRNRLKPTCSVPRRRFCPTTAPCWNSKVSSDILVCVSAQLIPEMS